MFFTYSKDLSFRANFPSRKFEHRKRLLWNTHSANLEPRQIESGVSWLCFGAIKTSYVTFIFSLIAVHLKKKTILINDSSCRGHFWLYAHVHLVPWWFICGYEGSGMCIADFLKYFFCNGRCLHNPPESSWKAFYCLH